MVWFHGYCITFYVHKQRCYDGFCIFIWVHGWFHFICGLKDYFWKGRAQYALVKMYSTNFIGLWKWKTHYEGIMINRKYLLDRNYRQEYNIGNNNVSTSMIVQLIIILFLFKNIKWVLLLAYSFTIHVHLLYEWKNEFVLFLSINVL